MRKQLVAALLWVFSPGLAAQWLGEAAAGYLMTSGNAETTSLNAKFALDYKAERWKNALLATATNTGDAARTTAERYLVSDKLDYNFSEQNYMFGVVEYEKDLFGGIRQRTSQTAGYGRHILPGPTHTWDAEIGAGARQTEAQVTGTKERDLIGRFSTAYQWKISETARFSETVKVEGGESNTLSESVTELKLNIAGDLAAVLSYSLRHNSRVPQGTEKLDTTAGVTLSYRFGKS